MSADFAEWMREQFADEPRGIPDRDTTIELDFDKIDGHHPQVVIRLLRKSTGEVFGEATFNADTAEAFAASVLRCANGVRQWIDAES